MTSNYYKFIKPVHTQPREPRLALGKDAVKAVDWLVQQYPGSVHYDLETTGLNYADPNQVITTVGLASPDWLIGIDLLDVPREKLDQLWSWLKKQPLGGFNLGFDVAWPWRVAREDGRVDQDIDDLNIISDTALWFRLLATEGHYLQSHNLETLIERVLQWPEECFQKSWLKQSLVKHGIKKDEMWRLSFTEPEGYTKYCALDAEASFQAHQVFQDTLERWNFQGLRKYHDQILSGNIRRNIKATCFGIPVNREKINRNIELVQGRLLYLESVALSHPEMRPHIEEYENYKLKKQHKLRCNQKKIWAKKDDEPWKYPEEYRLEHYDDNRLEKLPKWCRDFGGKFYKTETVFSISGKNKEWPRFNVNSTADMKWLIYDKWLDGKYDVWYKNPSKPQYGGLVTVEVDGKDYQVTLTDSGGLPTGGDILTLFGDIGSILNEYKTLKKLLGDFLLKYELASRRTGYAHAQTKILGALSGRAAGGNNQ